jgi:hypothetical protein
MIAFKAMFYEVTNRPTSRLVFGSRPVSYIIEKDCLPLAPSRRTVRLERPKLSLDHTQQRQWEQVMFKTGKNVAAKCRPVISQRRMPQVTHISKGISYCTENTSCPHARKVREE